MRLFVVLFSILTCSSLAATALAEPVSSDGPFVVEHGSAQSAVFYPLPERPRWHTGFYLRLGAGFGGMVDGFSRTGEREAEATASGATGAFEIAAGGSIKPGLVLGGGFFMDWMANPRIEIDGQDVTDQLGDQMSVGSLLMIGPMIDWYPNPDRGFHIQGVLAGARLDVSDSSGNVQHSPLGGAVLLGVGNEWRVGNCWGIGVLGRLTLAALGDADWTHRVGALSLLFTASFY